MKKSITLLILCILFIGNLSSQSCLPNGINLTTQEQIDAFPTAYPDCAIIEGRLRVRVPDGQDLINLAGLSQITEVKGDLYIELSTGASTVIDLRDLSNLTTIGGSLIILNSNSLINLDGLQNLSTIGEGISIVGNDGLQSLTGLDNLKRVEGKISISSNNNLKNLTGLGGLEYLGGYLNVDVKENLVGFAPLDTITGMNLEGSFIPSIVGLESITHIREDLTVVACGSITNLEGLANLQSIGRVLYIERADAFTSFALPNIESIGALSFTQNESLQNMQGLENLKWVNELSVINNPSFINFEGLDNFQQYFGTINISRNPALLNLNGFESLTQLGETFIIEENDLLSSIMGWNNVQFTGSETGKITSNRELSICNISGLCTYYSNSGQPLPTNIEINNNANDCNSPEEILVSCDTMGICLATDTDFTTQQEIDDFLIQNPNCNKALASIRIFGNDITNIDGLINIDSIAGNLQMFDLPNLQNLNGFSNLKKVDGLVEISNLQLSNFEGLENLEYAKGLEFTSNSNINFTGLSGLKTIGNAGLTIRNNPNVVSNMGFDNLENIVGMLNHENNTSLENMKGLENLKAVRSLSTTDNPSFINFEGLNSLQQIPTTILISRNPALLNFNGFESLTQAPEGFEIAGNNSLESITGWDNVVFNELTFGTITRNPRLSVCNALGLCDYYTNAGQPLPTNIAFSNNAAECENPEEVLNSCNTESCINIDTDFTTQQEIDDFLIQNPNCNKALASIRIFGNDITNIDGLINIDSIAGNLQMFNLPNLQNLNGFSNLRKVDGLIEISNLPLPNFEGLEKLEYAEGLEFSFNSNLDFTGFSGLQKVGNQGLTIRDNTDATSNNGFDNLETIEGILYYATNPSFENMDGFPALKVVEGEITFNENLTTISGLNALERYSGSLAFFLGELSDISGFQNLRSVSGDIYLSASSVNGFVVTGFNNLDSIGNDFRLDNFSSGILDLSGFNNVKYIGRHFGLENNLFFDQQGPFTGFNQLQTIGNEFYMGNCSYITDLSNFQSLRRIKRIKIEGNSELMNLDAFADLNFQNIEYLQIEFNVDLEVCANDAICNYLSNGGFSLISNNNDGCLDKVDVESNCNASRGKIRFGTFYDVNEDGIRQPTETLYGDASVSLEPLGYTLFGNPDSLSRVLLPTDNYSLTLNTPQDWRITSGNGIQTVDLTSGVNCDTVLFGIFPEVQGGKMATFISAPPTRCNEFIKFEVTAKNIGTTTTDGWLWLEVDNNILDIQFIDSPNTTSSANEFGWMITDVPPGNSVTKEILLQMPGPNDFPIGQNLVFKSFVNFEDNGVTARSDEFEYLAELRCAYDPNDKLVNPSREGNFTQFDEALIYTIRFQNTGNDFARDVAIRDEISAQLDLSTFQILGSSHYETLSTTIEDRLVTFDFSDIFLPDSTADFEGSIGYVMFSIQTNSSLSEFTDVENTASIFFDFNPPIVTNTALNVMVSSITDEDNDGFFVFQDCDDTNPNINPDAIEIPDNGIDEDCDGMDLLSGVEDAFSAKFKIYPNPTSGKIFIKGEGLQNAIVTLTDPTGLIFLVEKLNGSNSIQLPKETTGILFLTIEMEEGTAIKRILRF